MKKAPKRLTQKDYYVLMIKGLIKECDDLSLLDLVYQLLMKSMYPKAETTSENSGETPAPAHDNAQKGKAITPCTTVLELRKQYLIDTMQREHSEEWLNVVFAFVSHYKEA